uniref:ParB/RepB/Spo0J family partition protein n=1 Tax=Cupriavidus gilardii TaxID=82541 RepID=UPI002478FCCB|nr:hypothetical protein [Cupriavidus gilardii]WDE72662.1 hypothetical protein [Cupriavidus gilardii]
MSAPSFKQLIKTGVVKRADAMKVRYEDLHVEPGFNLRTAFDAMAEAERQEAEEDEERLFQHICNGGQYPALEVRPRAEGGVWIVDGHRRHRNIGRAIEAGAPLQDKDGEVWVEVKPFTGNDADRTARVLTSAENRPLKPLERAAGYKRLRNFGWDNARIAKQVGRTPQHVAQLLLLADAPSAVQKMVAEGRLSADEAVKAVRNHGEDGVTEALDHAMERARSIGKTKITGAVLREKPLPAKIVSSLVGSVDAFMGTLSTDVRTQLAKIEGEVQKEGEWPFPRKIEVDANALLALLKSHADVAEARARAAERQRAKESKAAQGSLPQ